MLIGTQYANNKLYRGIKHGDFLPLTSEDVHEHFDTLYAKNAYLLNNLIGSGTLNVPTCTISSAGISLDTPAVVLIDGDISLIQSDENTPIVSIEEIDAAGYTEGVLCVIGWYQLLTSHNTLRNYGGVKNSALENDLVHPELNMQVSARYQLRWDTCLVPLEYIENESPVVPFVLRERDENGVDQDNEFNLSTSNIIGTARVATKPEAMYYAVSDLYIIPILEYTYNSGSITHAAAHTPVSSDITGTSFLSSSSEPLGEYREGTVWYNPTSREFKTYIEGLGFVDSASKMGFIQYQGIYTFPESITIPQNITVPIEIDQFMEGDILTVVHEGLTLTPEVSYTVNSTDRTITLLDYTVQSGETITFTAIRIVEANNITSITAEFIEHVNTTGNLSVKGHVKLSDTANSTQGTTSGIAATPKAVYEASLVKDTAAGKSYKFVVDNGLLYLEEV